MNKSIFFGLFLAFLGLAAILGNSRPSSSGGYLQHLEAEHAAVITAPFEIGSELSASGGGYLRISKAEIDSLRRAGRAGFRFTLPADRILQVWIRAKSENPCVNSFYLAVDGKRRMIAGAGRTDGDWVWIRNSDLSLEEGDHDLEILAREELCLLDKIVLTDNPAYSPL